MIELLKLVVEYVLVPINKWIAGVAGVEEDWTISTTTAQPLVRSGVPVDLAKRVVHLLMGLVLFGFALLAAAFWYGRSVSKAGLCPTRTACPRNPQVRAAPDRKISPDRIKESAR